MLKKIPNELSKYKKKLEYVRDQLLAVSDGVASPIGKGRARQMADNIDAFLSQYRFKQYP